MAATTTTTTVLITGASRGLGRALVEAYLSRPDHTVIASVRDVNSATAASLKTFPTAQNSSVLLVKIDSTSDTDANDAVEAMRAAGIDHLDVVIANAGSSCPCERIESLELRDMREMLEVNTLSVVKLFQAVYPLLRQTADARGAGAPKFIAVSSQAASIQDLGDNTPWLLGSYGTSKCALNYIVRRAHFENEWLTAFVVDPGVMQTDMGKAGADRWGFDFNVLLPVKDSVTGIVQQVDNATRDSVSGKFVLYDGAEKKY